MPETNDRADAAIIAGGFSNVLNAVSGAPRTRLSAALGKHMGRFTAPHRRRVRATMTSPPTPTLGTTHTIGSPLHWPSVTNTTAGNVLAASSFTVCRAGSPAAYLGGSSYPNYLYVGYKNVNYGAGRQDNLYQQSFHHDGRYLEIAFKGTAGDVLLKVDDEYVSLTPQTIANDGNVYYWYFDFGARKVRRIDFIAGTSFSFGGVFTEANDTITPAPVRGPRVIVVGDSFTEGTGSNSGVNGYVMAFADAMGWDDVWPSGVGSTGYVAATAPKVNYRSRLTADVTAYAPDIVLFTGGYNDYSSTPAQITTEAGLLFGQARSELPDALLVCVSPYWNAGAAPIEAQTWAKRDALKAAIVAVGGLFVDLLEQPLPTGTTPSTSTLASAVAAGATSLSLVDPVAVGATYKWSDGTRFRAKAISGAGPYTVTTDGPLAAAHGSGSSLTQVGDCFWTGTGKVGATTGYGNCDLYVGSDGIHPIAAGHLALGAALAAGFLRALG